MTTTTQTTTGATTDTTHVVGACPCDEGVDSHCPSCAAHGKAAQWCRVCHEPVHVSDLGTDGLCGECRPGVAEGRTGDPDAGLADGPGDAPVEPEGVEPGCAFCGHPVADHSDVGCTHPLPGAPDWGVCECWRSREEATGPDPNAGLADAVLDRVARTERVLHAGVDEPRVLLTDLIEGLRGAATGTATRTGDLHQAAGWAVDVYQTVGGRDPQQAFPAAVEAAVTRLGSDVLLAAAVRAIVARAGLDGDAVVEAAGDGSCEACGGSDAMACLCGELAPVGNLSATASPRPAVKAGSVTDTNPNRCWAPGCSRPTVTASGVLCTGHLQAAAAFAADRVRQGDEARGNAVTEEPSRKHPQLRPFTVVLDELHRMFDEAADDPVAVADQDHDTDVVWCRACGEEPAAGTDGLCGLCRAGVVGSLPAPTPARRAGRAGGAS